ncbi:DUF1016 domain-containing protein [Rubneribacter badeniensis]|uniref:DUF1016 domain-containing protein n=1 Tax=Rubneribacter badeniensis TaxID=2070688 RepID=A0A2K2U882_9ACTN|nr:PDDEXK nuclease domain-containing protein [Rubneribacter badeniensis]PNV66408.1 DUF1016 domain-containing protein [Rubneribacter badeniensis]
MSKGVVKSDPRYAEWARGLSERYQRSQIKAAVSVNREMLMFYWSLGRDIVEMHAESRWGSGSFKELSRDLQREIPNVKGFSPRNLRYMKRFYELFPSFEFAPQTAAQITGDAGNEFLPQLVAKIDSASTSDYMPSTDAEIFSIPWGHIRLIIDKAKGDRVFAKFYIRETIENGWSRSVLMNYLDTNLYERQGKAVANFSKTLPAPQSNLAQEITRDPYQFDFLAIRKDHDEKELKDAIMNNVSAFLMELGTGFALMGREYRLKVGETEQWIDLLFYHAKLHCYVVIEVKATDFKPEYVGQLGTYVAAVNHILKTDSDEPTIGLLVCKDKDNVVAQYALESASQPIGISEYELSKLVPENFRSSLPTIEEIEEGLRDE